MILAAVVLASLGGVRAEPWGPNKALPLRSDPLWKTASAKIASRDGDPWLKRVLIGDIKAKVMRHGPTDRAEMAITIDDGPHGAETWHLLKMLQEEGAKATFFVVGKMVEDRQDVIRAMASSGHGIANHTFSHPNLEKLGLVDVLTEYKATSMAIQDIVGRQPRFARPPGGREDTKVLKAASALGMTTVYWNANPGDYKFEDPEEILVRLRAKRSAGAIVLCHSGLEATVEALRQFIRESKAMGYRFVLLDEWVDDKDRVSPVVAEPRRSVFRGAVGSAVTEV